MTVLHYIHHAAFSLNDGKTTLLFDPYLENNPEGLSSGDLKADYIFISHFHGDHVGEAYAIAKRTEALIITTAEIANDAKAHGLNAHAMHIGGSHEFPFGKVKLTLAFHGSGIAGGHACGFIVHFDGSVFYFAGDTGLFADMELIGKRNAIDYAFLPIGDNFTMGPPMPPGSLRPRPSSPSTTTRGPSSIRIQKNSRTLWRRRQVRRY